MEISRASAGAHEMGHRPFNLEHCDDALTFVMNQKISNVIALFRVGIQVEFSEASRTTIREMLDYE